MTSELTTLAFLTTPGVVTNRDGCVGDRWDQQVRIFVQMCAKKDFSLTTETLVGTKNSYTHERPMVSLQFELTGNNNAIIVFVDMREQH